MAKKILISFSAQKLGKYLWQTINAIEVTLFYTTQYIINKILVKSTSK